MRRIGSMRPSDNLPGNDYSNHNNHNNHSQEKASAKYSKLLAIDNMLANNICLKANLDNPVFPENITIDDNLYFSSGKSHEIAVLYDAENNQDAKLSLYAESFCFFPNSYIDTTVTSPFQISFEDNSDSNSIFPINGIISNYNTQYSWYNYNSVSANSELYMNISENGNISTKGTLFIAPIVDPEDSNYPSFDPIPIYDPSTITNPRQYFKVDPGTFGASDGSVVVRDMIFSVTPYIGGIDLLNVNPFTGQVKIEDGGLYVNGNSFSVTTNLLANVPATFSNPNDTDSFTIDTLTNKKVSTNNLPLEINGLYARLYTVDPAYPSNDADLVRKIDIIRLIQGFKPKGAVDIMTDMSIWGDDTNDTNTTSTITEIVSTGTLDTTGTTGSITFETEVDILTEATQGVSLEEGSYVLFNQINCTNNFTGIYSWYVTSQPSAVADGTYNNVTGYNSIGASTSFPEANFVVSGGVVTSFVLTDPGSGYTLTDPYTQVAFPVDGTNNSNTFFTINVTQNLQAACGIYVVSAGVFDSNTNIWTYTWVRRDNLENGSNAVGATVFVTSGTYENELFIQTNDQYQPDEGNPPVANTTTYVGQYQLFFEVQTKLLYGAGPGINITGQTISVDIGQNDAVYNNLIFNPEPTTGDSYLTIRDDPIFTPTSSGVVAPITTSITTNGINLTGGDTDEPGPAIHFNSIGDNGTVGQITGLFFSRNDEDPSTIIQTYYNGENSSDLQFWVTQKTIDSNSIIPYLAMTIQPTDIANTASVGINKTNPVHALDVNGNVRGTSMIALSDLRLKENIKPLENSLDKILAMQGVSYNLIDDENKVTQVGVVAQEIEKVLPEVVVTDADDMKSVAYGNITAVLIEAVKELQQQVNDLKSTVEELKK